MKKFIALVLALFLATAAFAEGYTASEKITQQVLAGSLTQTVYAGEEIAPIKILYGEIDETKHQSGGISELGLTEKWTGPVCEISGQIKSNLVAQTVTAYILVEDDEGKFAKTELSFEVKERPFLFALDETGGKMNQSVKAGETIEPIVFNYNAIEEFKVSKLVPGLDVFIDEEDHTIAITGTVDAAVESGDYDYTVTVKDKDAKEHSLSGTISVEGLSNITKIIVVENETQKVAPGGSLKPIVLHFSNVKFTEDMRNFKFEQTLPGSLSISVDDNIMTIDGKVDARTKDGLYSIKVIAKGEQNNDTAFAAVEVVSNANSSSSSASATSSSSSASVSSSSSAGQSSSSSASAKSSNSKSSSSSAGSSSSAESGKSSSSKKSDRIVAETVTGAKFGYANNTLTVALPAFSMVRVQVFDLTGHLVESLAEPVSGSRSFSLAHLNSGSYLVRVESSSLSRTAKITVK